ncbi:(4Fe-4S)-binding protein [Taibaiella koreensis]|uniref:(4Fe-4S)-binding protein n=1 Tax=Taibaiella koreensis TaxID=1268548 RepID=UPI000E59DFE0|nr:(4Fe-4S)-binding protein [Taibaiella koreensis]
MDKEIVKHYSNGTLTVVWQPGRCVHSTVCWKQATGLPEVFNPKEKPWIKIEGADSDRIAAQVAKCPSGALSSFYNEEGPGAVTVSQETKIEVSPNGPLLVYGNITVKDKEGNESRRTKVTAFCRCGQSQNKPYCDGSHIPSGFEG